MRNIVFIGMPGSGKTTVGSLVASRLGRAWFDCDRMIEQEEGQSVSALFAARGEEYFRAREADCLRRLQQQEGAVISAGGGAVLHGEALLKTNATVVYLERSIQNILNTLDEETRPLAQGGEKRLRELLGERRALYERLSDITVTNNGSIADTVTLILEELPCDF